MFLIENGDRVILDLDQSLLLELAKNETDGLSAATDEVGDFLLSEVHFQSNRAAAYLAVRLAEIQQEMSQASRNVAKDQILDPIADSSKTKTQ